jgi:hypothetical protein
MGAKTLKRVLASAFVVIGGAAIVMWVWPEDGSILFSSLAVMSALLGSAVVVSLWQK